MSQICTFSSYSFGCRVNQAETEVLDSKLLSLGFQAKSASPDFHIINTCAVTAKAEREARQYIYRYKRSHPNTKIIITGCSATYWQKNHIYANLPVDLTISNHDKDKLPKMLLHLLGLEINESTHFILPQDKFTVSGRAMVKIQDGCHRFCTYCIVPYLRGLPKSETIAQIVQKVKSLENEGIKEVILTAINTEAFGKDTGENLTDLIKAILSKTSIDRISFGSIHPWSLTDEFLKYYETIKNEPRFIHFFHVPLQSCSEKVLRLMKRGYDINVINDKLTQISNINPFALIATDIIAGFLGETKENFQETYEFLEKSAISKFHVFPFSVRNNTAAYYLLKQYKDLPLKIKKERTNRLIELGKSKLKTFIQMNIGRETTSLILKKPDEGYVNGLLDNQLPVKLIPNKCLPGIIKNVKITGIKNFELVGKISGGSSIG